ncbi:tRNA preQ1(34) S-adenosylmethionine ribosyltransferase-isomerase QueA [Anaerofilum sp. BX8]|uniref:S-adenosylmethionine:tRNA ribosyltransferase-isomerase n=1 Tax=Anaerofilum hominis TaxID=2763016 RepID=A0A923KUQ3_9FIRM|nr:tRNA preQ1(34) S-adenosylmethionine ribosyltransferase-isomerase QueA [Anaerofilum hominis]MBC5579951.1 tRNA preQ1(34) S-adenosylmethionine ribosyltransferase-isomerase QueA [Anaerofilum hominis]
MQKSDFYYDLPKSRIAQEPAEPRDSARLMVLGRSDGEISHHVFRELTTLLDDGDLLVVNNSKVLPARLLGVKEGTGAACEILILRPRGDDVWECLAKPGKRLKTGARVVFGDGVLTAEILETTEEGNKIVSFTHPDRSFYQALELVGRLPLPHYIEKEMEDDSEYQTVYAKEPGSAAAPTAGLHFTGRLLEELKQKGVRVAEVTLHVGLGTFRPVKVDDITQHHMHTEWYSVSEETADLIRRTKAAGRRVIAVGTTSCRTLESVYQAHGEVCACQGDTDIFMYPGFTFRVIDGLITNFHLPESTLIMLVSAFAGYDHTMAAYRTAVEEGYRFYSFGDAMLIL